MRNPWVRALVGLVAGLLLFFAMAWLLKRTLPSAVLDSPALSQIALKGVLVLVALVGWTLTGRPYREMGWRRAPLWNRSYAIWFAIGAVAMMGASIAMILMDRRHPVAAEMDLLQLILCVWLVSSFSEEVYVRGLWQSWMADRDSTTGAATAFHPAIVSSALLFSGMHASLISTPAGKKGGLTIMVAVLFLGWACAVLRARTKGLWPPIACHIFGNVMGLPGGILGILLYRIIYHRVPDFVSHVNNTLPK